jgi:hypothetical protein
MIDGKIRFETGYWLWVRSIISKEVALLSLFISRSRILDKKSCFYVQVIKGSYKEGKVWTIELVK